MSNNRLKKSGKNMSESEQEILKITVELEGEDLEFHKRMKANNVIKDDAWVIWEKNLAQK